MVYMGSKSRIIKDLLPIILKNREPAQWYVEPFAGGMNAICEVQGNRIANDVHPHLIEMWHALVGGWVPKKITKEEYKNVRLNQDDYPSYFVGWVGFSCSYSCKWFGGFANSRKGRDYQIEAFKNISKQINKIKGTIFSNKSYLDLEIPPNSIVYCDPPYEGTTKYTGELDHDEFWEWARRMSRRGHTVFVSEYKSPSDFECVWEKDLKSFLALGKRGSIRTEKLFKLNESN